MRTLPSMVCLATNPRARQHRAKQTEHQTESPPDLLQRAFYFCLSVRILPYCPSPLLLFNYAAGDPVAGVAGGIRHQVVCLGVNHYRCAALVKERSGAFIKGRTSKGKCRMPLAVLAHNQVRQIAYMRFWIHCIVNAVMGTGGIEVPAGRGKRRAFALSDCVDVNPMFARRQLRYLD